VISADEGDWPPNSGLLYPPRRIGIADQVEKPAKQSYAVSTPEPEPGRVGRQSVRDRTWAVMARPDGISHQIGDRLGILPVVQKVSGYTRWPSGRQSADDGPLAVTNWPLVKPDVGPARLPPLREREVMLVRRKMAEAV
jgi:hypothetical protein